VVGLRLSAESGYISAVPDIPRGWFVSVTNDASGRADITANAQVGAAATDIGFLQRFVTVREQNKGDPIKKIELEIVVTSDFLTERRIRVPWDRLRVSSDCR
jgi:hypothetical protein